MASQPDDRRRTEEAAALALFLAGRRLDLPALIRQQGLKPRPFRRIATTSAMQAGMAAPYFDIVRAWLAQRPALMEAYARARVTGNLQLIQQAIDQAEVQVRAVLPFARAKAQAATASLERWHRSTWIQRVKMATGIDVSPFTAPQDVQPDVDAASAWAQQLTQSVHQEAHAKVAAAFLAAAVAIKPLADAQADFNAILARAKRRAASIGVDQADRTSAGMDRSRRAAAGLGRFRWRHTPQRHPRVDHKARDGRVYTQANAPNDRAGVLPFCRCHEEPLWD